METIEKVETMVAAPVSPAAVVVEANEKNHMTDKRKMEEQPGGQAEDEVASSISSSSLSSSSPPSASPLKLLLGNSFSFSLGHSAMLAVESEDRNEEEEVDAVIGKNRRYVEVENELFKDTAIHSTRSGSGSSELEVFHSQDDTELYSLDNENEREEGRHQLQRQLPTPQKRLSLPHPPQFHSSSSLYNSSNNNNNESGTTDTSLLSFDNFDPFAPSPPISSANATSQVISASNSRHTSVTSEDYGLFDGVMLGSRPYSLSAPPQRLPEFRGFLGMGLGPNVTSPLQSIHEDLQHLSLDYVNDNESATTISSSFSNHSLYSNSSSSQPVIVATNNNSNNSPATANNSNSNILGNGVPSAAAPGTANRSPIGYRGGASPYAIAAMLPRGNSPMDSLNNVNSTPSPAPSEDEFDKLMAGRTPEDYQELLKAVCQRIEACFDSDNLPHNAQLLSYIRKNRDGYVPLAILFNRVRMLTDDPNVVVEAIRGSQMLALSEDNMSVRKRQFFVRLENLPQKCTRSQIAKMVSDCGVVKRVQLYQYKTFAVVEFASEAAAEAAARKFRARHGYDDIRATLQRYWTFSKSSKMDRETPNTSPTNIADDDDEGLYDEFPPRFRERSKSAPEPPLILPQYQSRKVNPNHRRLNVFASLTQKPPSVPPSSNSSNNSAGAGVNFLHQIHVLQQSQQQQQQPYPYPLSHPHSRPTSPPQQVPQYLTSNNNNNNNNNGNPNSPYYSYSSQQSQQLLSQPQQLPHPRYPQHHTSSATLHGPSGYGFTPYNLGNSSTAPGGVGATSHSTSATGSYRSSYRRSGSVYI